MDHDEPAALDAALSEGDRPLLVAAGDGRIAAATRSDFAEAAAVVLVGRDHAGQVYELGGESFTLAEFRQTMSQLGLPGPVVAMLVSAEAVIASGALDTNSTHLANACHRSAGPPSSHHARTRNARSVIHRDGSP